MTNTTHIPDEAVQAKRHLIQSYNWSFKPTGIDAIDDILASIADAAESYHNTSQWKDEGHIDRIQKYADVAAAHLSAPCAVDVDALANEIRRVNGSNNLGAGALAEALMPFLSCVVTKPVDVAAVRRQAFEEAARVAETKPMRFAGQTEKTVREMITSAIRALSAESAHSGRKYKLGDRLTKTKGSKWTGRVVGFYSTKLTPIGYAIESETETGSVQIYPEAALTSAEPEAGK